MALALWLTASLLALMALAFVLPALLRTSQSGSVARSQVNVAIARERERELRAELHEGALSDAEFDAARAELEQGLAIDLEGDTGATAAGTTSPLVAAGISAVLPLAALGIYLFLGMPSAIDTPNTPVQPDSTTAGQQPDVDTLLAQLKARLADEPDDIQGWTLLANALMSTGRYTEAVPAYRRLVELRPGDPELLVRLADALAMSRNGVLAGEPEARVRQALALAPMHPQALWLAGIAAEQSGAYVDALEIFNRLLPLVSDQPEVLAEVRALISRTTAAMAGKAEEVTERLRITISVDPALAGTITARDTLFVYARIPDGPPMPVAVRKLTAQPLPREVTLSDSDLMLPGGGLASYPKLQVGAHISRLGTVTKAPGDLLGLSETFDPGGSSAVKVVIASTVSQ